MTLIILGPSWREWHREFATAMLPNSPSLTSIGLLSDACSNNSSLQMLKIDCEDGSKRRRKTTKEKFFFLSFFFFFKSFKFLS
jgi:hypothetical protein